MLSKEEVEELKTALAAVKKGVRREFAYIEKGLNGDPVLMVGRRIKKEQVKAKRKAGRPCMGTVTLKDDKKGYIFTVDKSHPKFQKHLMTFFGKVIPKLKKSDIQLVDANGQQTILDAQTLVEQAEQEYQQEKQALTGEQAKLQQEIDRLMAKAKAADDEAQTMRDSYFTLKSTAQKKQREADDLRAQIEKLLQQKSVIEQDIADVEQELEHTDVADERAKLESERDVDQQRLAELEDDVSKKEAAEAQALAEVERLKQQAMELKRLAKAKQMEAAQERQKAESMKGSLFTFKSTRKKQEAVAAQAEDASAAMAAQLEDLEKALALAQEAAQEASTARAEAREASAAALDIWDDQCAAFWTEREDPEWVESNLEIMENAGTNTRKAREEYNQAKAKLNALEQEILTAKGDSAKLKATVERNNQRHEHVSAVLNNIKTGKGTLDSATARKLEAYTQELKDLAKDNERIQALRKTLKEQVAEKNTARKQMAPRVEELRQILDAAKDELYDYTVSTGEREHTRALSQQLADAETSQKNQASTVERLRVFEKNQKQKVQDVIDARKKRQDAHTEYNLLLMEEKATKKLAEQWAFRDKTKAERDAARQKLLDIQARMPNVKAAYEQAEKALTDATAAADGQHLKDVEEASRERIAAEAELAKQNEAIAHIEEALASEASRAATLVEDLAANRLTDVLNELAETTPALKQAQTDLSQAEHSAQQKEDAFIHAQNELQYMVEEIQALTPTETVYGTAEDQEKDKAAHLKIVDPQELQAKLRALTKLRETVRLAEQAMDEAVNNLEQSQREHDQVVEGLATENDRVNKLLQTRTAAQTEAQIAEQDEINSIATRREAQKAMTEAARAAQALPAITEMSDYLSDKYTLIDQFHQLKDPASPNSSASIDLLSSDHVDHIREVIHAKKENGELSESDQALQDLLAFQDELEHKAVKMIQAGCTPDELRAAFVRVPNGIRPPSYRAEVDAFDALEATFATEDSISAEKARQKSIIDAAQSLMTDEERQEEIEHALTSLGKNREEIAAFMKDKPNPADWGLFTNLAKQFQSLTDDNMDEVVRQKKQDECLETMIGIAGLGSSGARNITQTIEFFGGTSEAALDTVSSVTYGISAGLSACMMIKNAAEAAARKAKKDYDTLLKNAAMVAGSPLAASFEESIAREKQLWGKYATKATLDAMSMVASVLQMTPLAAIGAIMSWTTMGLKAANTAGHMIYDMAKAKEAKRILEDARRGSDRAKVDLFKHHQRYAKGLIAHMAFVEKDRFAQLYCDSRGVNEAAVRTSSTKILTHYLLMKAEQSFDPKDFDDRINMVKTKLKRPGWIALNVLLVGIPAGINELIEMRKDKIPEKDLKELEALVKESSVLQDNYTGAGELVAQIEEQIAESSDPKPLERLRDRLIDLRNQHETLFSDLCQKAAEGLAELAKTQNRIQSLEAVEGRLNKDDLSRLNIARMWEPKVRKAQHTIINTLATAAY